MIVAGIVVAIVLYACGLMRVEGTRRAIGLPAVVSFGFAMATLAAALLGPLDDLADTSLSWHMVQHMALIDIVAPLLILGAPVRLALAALPQRAASRLARALASPPIRWLTHPAVAWLQLALVLYGVHFSPLYEAALENEGVHAVEHLIFLASGVVFWLPMLAVAPTPHAPSYPVRIFAVFLALPMSAFLGFIFYVARHALYAHYAALPGALTDQMNAGAVMWIAGGGPLFVALLWLVAEWGARERRYGAIADGTL